MKVQQVVQNGGGVHVLYRPGFGESYNGSARVINLCTFRNQPMQNKQVHHGGIIFIKRFLSEFSRCQYLSTCKQKDSKVFLLSNMRRRHPCVRCPTHGDCGQKSQLALSRKLRICINCEKEEYLVRYNQIFEKIFLEIPVPFDFHPGISEIFG